MDLFRKCMDPVEKCLRDAKMDKVRAYLCVLCVCASACICVFLCVRAYCATMQH